MKYRNISKCCGVKAFVTGTGNGPDYGGTNYFECAKCGQGCDVDRKKIDLNKMVELIRRS